MSAHAINTAAVVGAGVVGLTAAVRLLERGLRVTIFAERRTPGTTSNVAPAMFTPYKGDDPVRSRAWVGESLRVYEELARTWRRESGVRIDVLREYFYNRPGAPAWAGLIAETPVTPTPAGFAAVHDTVRPHIDTTRYLHFLEARVKELGGEIVNRRVARLADLHAEGFGAVVNCAGLGARELAGDSRVRAMRGQILHTKNEIGVTRSLHDDAPGGVVTYVFLYDDHLALGSTFEVDVEEERTEDAAIEAIVQRCRELLRVDGHPRWNELGGGRLRRLAGLRPTREGEGTLEAVRLEVERTPSGVVIHNYGHGRSGVTLCWGCAAEVAGLIERG